jgi:hypothetical protein
MEQSTKQTRKKRKRSLAYNNNLHSTPPPTSPHHKMVFIGQAPGPTFLPSSSSSSSTSATTPPALVGLSAARLARLAGMPEEELWKRCDRRNIFNIFPGTKPKSQLQTKAYRLHESVGDRFDMDQARKLAAAIDITKYHLVVLLGLNVAKAFRLQNVALFKEYYIDDALNIQSVTESKTFVSGTRILIYPHPSGVSHYWNKRSNRYKAMTELRLKMVQTGIIKESRSKFFTSQNRISRSKYFKTGATP